MISSKNVELEIKKVARSLSVLTMMDDVNQLTTYQQLKLAEVLLVFLKSRLGLKKSDWRTILSLLMDGSGKISNLCLSPTMERLSYKSMLRKLKQGSSQY